MYKTIMIWGVIIVGVGWAIYGLYSYIMYRQEQKQPKVRSRSYDKAQGSMNDYAQKMAKFEKKRYNKEQ